MKKDPNCITLTSLASHRLGEFFGTFEDKAFSQTLEEFMDGQATKIETLQEKNKALKQEVQAAHKQLRVLAVQRLYLVGFLALAVGATLTLLI